ncbi:High_cysteine non-variant cyst protein [Hexamita inflata]|uniref:High cysteine non-variant cyst protein n=1 Tax=Hexamita inflata TaxID=28002 RepID=A0AA86TDD1_9EUKA|nr:High cysteine non-variant cyst protein [Hexamita inflata]
MKVINQNGDDCVICDSGLGFNPTSTICEQCPTGSNPIGGQCVCDKSLGFTGLDGFACTDCYKASQIVVGKVCKSCPSKTTFSVNKCVCDESKGFVGDVSSCSNCWIQNMVVSKSQCQDCQINYGFNKLTNQCILCNDLQRTIINKQCVCNELNGFGGVDALQCISCWQNQQQTISYLQGGGCVSCKVGTKFVILSDIGQCVPCNTLIGEATIAGVCTNCWSQMKVINQNGDDCVICDSGLGFNPTSTICEQCPTGSNPIGGQCVCDKSSGLAGSNGFACTECWIQNMVVKASSCISCQQLDLNSVFSVNSCQCAPKFVNKTGVCEVNTRNMTITIAVSVPIVVVILSLAVILFVLKRKLKKTAENREVVEREIIYIYIFISLPRYIYIYIYIYIHFTSSRRHKQTSLRLSKAKHGFSHASVSTFKTGSTRHLCPLSKDPIGPSLSCQRTSFT